MNEAAKEAFNKLKTYLTKAPVFAFPKTGKDAEFTVVTDACDKANGFALHQDQGSGLQPVAYEARKLSKHEMNYPVQEKELLGAVEAVRVFRTYLQGCAHFTV